MKRAVQAGILVTVVTEMPRTVTAQQMCTLIECPKYNALRCLLAQVISSLTSSPSVHGELNVCVTEFHMNSGLHVRTHFMLCRRVNHLSGEGSSQCPRSQGQSVDTFFRWHGDHKVATMKAPRVLWWTPRKKSASMCQ